MLYYIFILHFHFSQYRRQNFLRPPINYKLCKKSYSQKSFTMRGYECLEWSTKKKMKWNEIIGFQPPIKKIQNDPSLHNQAKKIKRKVFK